jgi:lysophospholipase
MLMSLIRILGLLALMVNASTAKDTLSYAPTYVDCPADVEWLREAKGLSSKESHWVQGRKRVVADAFKDYLENLDMENFSVSEYIQRIREDDFANVPILAFAISGGGWRSGLGGAGAYRALDTRLGAAREQRTGGLLQSLTYTTGQSGGNWPTLSMPLYGFPTVDEITKSWKPWLERFVVKHNSNHAETDKRIFEEIAEKAKAGFNVSLADFFGRDFAWEFVPGERGGIETTVSSITRMEGFKNFSMPMPMSVVSEVLPGDDEYFGLKVPPVDGSAILYELSPFEFGAWKGPSGFTPTEFLGTSLRNGTPADIKKCVKGFDNAGYITGSCASAFNFWYIEGASNGSLAQFSKRSMLSSGPEEPPSLVKRNSATKKLVQITTILANTFKKYFGVPMENAFTTPWPNPFYQLKRISSKWYNGKFLELVDATEVGQAIPFWPLIQPERHVSLVFAWDDDGAETPLGWGNGTNLYVSLRSTISSCSTSLIRHIEHLPCSRDSSAAFPNHTSCQHHPQQGLQPSPNLLWL